MWEPTKAPIDPTDISKVWSPVQIDTPGTYRICHLDEWNQVMFMDGRAEITQRKKAKGWK